MSIEINSIRELLLYIQAIEDASDLGEGEAPWSPSPKQWAKIRELFFSLVDVAANDEMEEKVLAIFEVLSVLNERLEENSNSIDELGRVVDETLSKVKDISVGVDLNSRVDPFGGGNTPQIPHRPQRQQYFMDEGLGKVPNAIPNGLDDMPPVVEPHKSSFV